MTEKSLYRTYMDDGMSHSAERGHSIYLRFIRWLGVFPFYIFHKLGLSANAASFTGFLLELVGVAFFIMSYYYLAALFIFIGVIFDFFDGVLARVRKSVGTLNTALTCSPHHFFTPTLVAAAGFVNYYFVTGDSTILLLGILVGLCSALTFQLLLIRGRALFKYYPKHAHGQEEIILHREKSLFFKGEELIERIISHSHFIILVYAFEPLIFLWFYTIIMPLRFVGTFGYFYFNNKTLEKKLAKYKHRGKFSYGKK